MTAKQPISHKTPAPQNLSDHYRPLALKAVLAAALMLKRKTAVKIA